MEGLVFKVLWLSQFMGGAGWGACFLVTAAYRVHVALVEGPGGCLGATRPRLGGQMPRPISRGTLRV